MKDYTVSEGFILEVARVLAGVVGRGSAITNREIARRLGLVPGNSASGGYIRNAIHEIRARGIVPCLIAGHRGYYVADSVEEVQEYIGSLKHRSSSIDLVAYALENQAARRFEAAKA